MKIKAENFPAIRRFGLAVSVLALLSASVAVQPVPGQAEVRWHPSRQISGPSKQPAQPMQPEVKIEPEPAPAPAASPEEQWPELPPARPMTSEPAPTPVQAEDMPATVEGAAANPSADDAPAETPSPWASPKVRLITREILGVPELPGYAPLAAHDNSAENQHTLLVASPHGKQTFQFSRYDGKVWVDNSMHSPWIMFNGKPDPGSLTVETIRVRHRRYPVIHYRNSDPSATPNQYVAFLDYPDDALVVLYGMGQGNEDLLPEIEHLVNDTRLKYNLNYPDKWPLASAFDPDAAQTAAESRLQAPEAEPSAAEPRIEAEQAPPPKMKKASAEKSRRTAKTERPRRKEKYPAVTNPTDGKVGPALPHNAPPSQPDAEPSWQPETQPPPNSSGWDEQPSPGPGSMAPSEGMDGHGDMPAPTTRDGAMNSPQSQNAGQIAGKVQKQEAPADAPASKTPAKAQKKPVSAKKAQASGSHGKKEKPVVHFPGQLQPQPVASAAKTSPSSVPSNGRLRVPAPLSPQQQYMVEEAMLHYRRGNSYGHRDRIDEAISEYQKALELYPAFADAHVGLSTAYARQNDWEQVIEQAMAVTQKPQLVTFMDPDNQARAWYNLSTAYCVADDQTRARRYYKKVKLAGYPNADRLWTYIQKNCD